MTRHRGQLELREDIRHQYREWRVEHIAWIFLALVIAAAIAGLLGPGPLSHAVAGEQGSNLWVDYQRVARYQAPLDLRVHFRQLDPASPTTSISINRNFYEAVEVNTISPEPVSEQVTTDQVILIFNAQTASGPAAVNFHLQPKQRWLRAVNVSIDGREQRSFQIFVLP